MSKHTCINAGAKVLFPPLAPLASLVLVSIAAADVLSPKGLPAYGGLKPLAIVAPTLPQAPQPVKGLRAYHRAEIDPQALDRRLKDFRRGAFLLDLGAYRFDLELEPSTVRSPGYTVRHLTGKGVVTVAPTPDRNWRGRLRGHPRSRVRLSFQDGRINGFVDDGAGERVFLEPLDHFLPAAGKGLGPVPHAVYREADVVPEQGVGCGLADAGAGHGSVRPGGLAPWGIQGGAVPGSGAATPRKAHEIAIPGIQAKPSAAGSGESAAQPEACGLAELAIAADYSMVRGLGTAAAVEKRINEIYNMVDALYQDPNVNIHVRITEVFIETVDKATWGGTQDINRNLNSLTSWMTGPNGFQKPFDVASLWYYHLGGGTVGLAWMGVICNNNRSNVVRYFTATSRSLMIDAAHEMGHNFSAPHIENPSWIMNPAITGSNDKWDASTISKVVAHKNSRNCMSACDVSPIAGFAMSGGACAETRSFTDQSAGEPTAWQWDFGDGTTSTQRNPTHTFVADGKFTVKLTATNAFGSSSASRGNVRVKDIPPPLGRDADGCAPSALTLSATGSGTLRWYDTATGGMPVAVGATFTTPVLTKARTYYVEDGEPDAPSGKLGPVNNSMGAGQNFTSNGDRRLFFDVARPAILVSAKVYAGSAGPRIVEILDAKDKRLMAKTVQVPSGESRIQLGFPLQPGNDYAIKVVGSGDSANLFRNSAGADYPYYSPDTLVTITGSDATAADSVTQSGYYYFFYDWEVREQPCASPRIPVQAKLSCTSRLADGMNPLNATLRPLSRGRYTLTGSAPEAGRLTVTLRTLDGALLQRTVQGVAKGPLSLPLDLAKHGSKLLLFELHLGQTHLRQIIPSL